MGLARFGASMDRLLFGEDKSAGHAGIVGAAKGVTHGVDG
jgi:hypothetical protein